MSQSWREAATVILTSLRSNQKSLFNYDVLSIKRSANISFMPGTHVFPGGTSHPADSSKRWLEVFRKLNINLDSEIESSFIPPILKNTRDDLPKLISLKITAIRETFEETGIILCRRNEGFDKWISSFPLEESNKWRSRVEKDAYEFIHLCEQFKCCPDVNSLYLWNNWLTPRNKKKRFDTLFFIASSYDKPTSAADRNEIDEIAWETPEELIEQNEKDAVILPPPQLYEMYRLMNFKNCTDLVDFSRKRAWQGCERWMPKYIQTNDGPVSLLPGDSAYNTFEEGYEGLGVTVPVVNMTRSEFQSKSEILHRFEGKKILTNNYTPKHGHLLPLPSLINQKFNVKICDN